MGTLPSINRLPPQLAFLFLLFSGWVNRQQQDAIDYLLEENRILRAAHGPRCVRLIANAFIFLFERFLSGFLQTLPPGLRLEDQLLYSVHVVMILVTFTVGVLLVPSLTSSIFSGRSGESTLPDRIGF